MRDKIIHDLEQEVWEINLELEMLYYLEHQIQPFVDDGVRADIYALQRRLTRIKLLILAYKR